MRYLFQYLLLCLTTGMFVYNAGAQIDHETIDWEAVDSAFYEQYDPEIPPKWLFPIIFEEGTGMRDTVYLGYHSEAKPMLSGDNKPYGERFVPYDSSYFNAGWSHMTENSSRNVRVASLYENEKIRAGSINFHKAVYPLFMYWNVERFWSDSLPFEDQSPAPRAEGLLYVNDMYPENESGNIEGCDMHIPALITDSARHASCVGRHFFVFDNQPQTDFDEVQPIQGFEIRKWHGYYNRSSIERPAQGTTVSLYPNPSSGRLNIDSKKPGRYRVISITGKMVAKGKIETGNTIIDLSNLHAGIYLFQLHDENYKVQYNEKLIINP